MDENLIIVNRGKLEKSKNLISKQGVKKLHILSDFDKTLTKAFVWGKSVPSLISLLRDGDYLGQEYAEKAHQLYDKYHPIEINPNIPLFDKKKAMEEWWNTHFDLLIKSGLNKKHLRKMVETGGVEFREGFTQFSNFLKENKIPLVIMSSSGLGGDTIRMYLEKYNLISDNVYIISNCYQWDESENAVSIEKPIIHNLNKEETMVKNFPFFKNIKNRKNVILLGDSLQDIAMIEDFDYENLIKIGFLNEEIEENLEEYKKVYDVLILNDGSMSYLNELVKSF